MSNLVEGAKQVLNSDYKLNAAVYIKQQEATVSNTFNFYIPSLLALALEDSKSSKAQIILIYKLSVSYYQSSSINPVISQSFIDSLRGIDIVFCRHHHSYLLEKASKSYSLNKDETQVLLLLAVHAIVYFMGYKIDLHQWSLVFFIKIIKRQLLYISWYHPSLESFYNDINKHRVNQP